MMVIYGDLLRNKILKEVSEGSTVFSVIADEVTDVANDE